MKNIAIFSALLFAAHIDAQEWTIETLGEGSKPEIALDTQGRPHIAYMLEEQVGGTYYAVRDAGSWQISEVAPGYFYGPLDIALDATDLPHIAYHDHDAADNIDDGDVVHAYLQDGQWQLHTVRHPGHDGWDSTIALDSQGRVHIASIDPVQFGATAGLEWALGVDEQWTVEAIGSGPLPYEFGTAIAIDSEDRPHIAYHSGDERLNTGFGSDLFYAVLLTDGWTIAPVDVEGDVGKFPSLVLDSQDRPHIANFERDERSAGYLKYAFWDGSTWHMESVDRMENMNIAFIGARRSMALALDDQDRPHIAYSNRATVKYIRKVDGAWEEAQTVAAPTAGGLELGQLVSLALGPDGQPHLTFFELPENARTSTGTVYYAAGPVPPKTPTAITEVAGQAQPQSHTLEQNYPNPFNPTTTIRYALPHAGPVRLDIYDSTGQHIRTLLRAHLEAGTYQASWDGTDEESRAVASGLYLSRLSAAGFAQVRKMVLLR